MPALQASPSRPASTTAAKNTRRGFGPGTLRSRKETDMQTRNCPTDHCLPTDTLIRAAIFDMRRLRDHWETGGSARGALSALEHIETTVRNIRANLEAHSGD